MVGQLEGLAKVVTQIGGVAAIGALVIALYLLWRTGSAHLLRWRIWTRVCGKDHGLDEQVRKFMERRTSLMAFRYISGVPMRTLERSQRLIKWLEDNDEDIGTIALVGEYFDREELQLKANLPSRKTLWLLLFGMASAMIAFTLIGNTWFSDRGYFTLKQSGQWFSATATDIRSVSLGFMGESTTLNKEACAQPTIPRGVFSDADAVLLCSFLPQPEFSKFVEKAKNEQQIVLIIMAVMCGLGIAMMVAKLRQADCVFALKRRLENKMEQKSFDF